MTRRHLGGEIDVDGDVLVGKPLRHVIGRPPQVAESLRRVPEDVDAAGIDVEAKVLRRNEDLDVALVGSETLKQK